MATIVPRFAYRLAEEDGEVFFEFNKLPEIFTALPREDFEKLSADERQDYAHDAVITALAARVTVRNEIPEGDDETVLCDGSVELDVVEAMKLALYEVYLPNFRNGAEFAQRIGKSETAARRLLDFRHQSRPAEIEAAMARLGKRLHHEWRLVAA